MKYLITTNAEDLRTQLSPLFHIYPGQHSYQPAYLEICPGQRSIVADYSAEIGSAVPMAIWHCRMYRIYLPSTLRGSALATLLTSEDILVYADSIFEGYTEVWDGNNYKGHLDDEAEKAINDIEMALHDRFDDDDFVQVWDVSDWLYDWTPTIGQFIDDAVMSIKQDATACGVVLLGDVYKYLQANKQVAG